MDMIAQYGVTTEAAKRIMGNCRMLICTMVDNLMDPDCVDTGWREWMLGNDIEVREEDRPSDFLKNLSDEELFQRLVSDGTFYGGMTSAIEACRCMRELGIEVDGWRD